MIQVTRIIRLVSWYCEPPGSCLEQLLGVLNFWWGSPVKAVSLPTRLHSVAITRVNVVCVSLCVCTCLHLGKEGGGGGVG